MEGRKAIVTLYGLGYCETIIEKIITTLRLEGIYFDVKLILIEAITNAFIHGNKKDESKPIYVKYSCDQGQVIFEIEDCGAGFGTIQIPKELGEENFLEESGRGLYLISCFCDKVELKNNSIIMNKTL